MGVGVVKVVIAHRGEPGVKVISLVDSKRRDVPQVRPQPDYV